jgi:hypothetical protein
MRRSVNELLKRGDDISMPLWPEWAVSADAVKFEGVCMAGVLKIELRDGLIAH